MEEQELIRFYRDRLRIFLIIYFFSENNPDPQNENRKKVLRGESKIQAIDFFLRNPDYLAYELLSALKNVQIPADEIKPIIKDIFNNNEPVIRRIEMQKFLFGAYEDIDDVISFLKSVDLIDFSSKRRADLRIIDKSYYITQLAIDKTEKQLKHIVSIQWYIKRCKLIKKYFGNKSGSELKALQYKIEEYKNTTYKEYISKITQEVKDEYYKQFGENL